MASKKAQTRHIRKSKGIRQKIFYTSRTTTKQEMEEYEEEKRDTQEIRPKDKQQGELSREEEEEIQPPDLDTLGRAKRKTRAINPTYRQ